MTSLIGRTTPRLSPLWYGSLAFQIWLPSPLCSVPFSQHTLLLQPTLLPFQRVRSFLSRTDPCSLTTRSHDSKMRWAAGLTYRLLYFHVQKRHLRSYHLWPALHTPFGLGLGFVCQNEPHLQILTIHYHVLIAINSHISAPPTNMHVNTALDRLSASVGACASR